MDLVEEIKETARFAGADFQGRNGSFTLTRTVAERKAFLSQKKLVYTARLSVDEKKKELRFAESLKETGFGLSMGGDSELTPGFGFKTETYKTGTGPRQGNIQEQSDLFGRQYSYTFDFSKIRESVEKKTVDAGYSFHYSLF